MIEHRSRLAFSSLPLAAALGLAFFISACAPVVERAQPETRQQELVLTEARFSDLSGWDADGVADAMGAFRASCRHLIEDAAAARADSRFGAPNAWRDVCDAAFRVRPGADHEARRFFEKYFRPWRASALGVDGKPKDEGLFTGYFEPEIKGSKKKSDEYSVPLLAPPSGIVSADLGLFNSSLRGQTITGRVRGDRLVPMPTRADIEKGALASEDLEILWLADPVDAFFLHVQGSGRIVMPDGKIVRVGFAGRNGHTYTAIGRTLIESGAVRAEDMSMQAIREWILKNPERGRELMRENESYIFFRTLEGDNPTGAAGAELTPGRSLAVDRRHIPFGVPLWLETTEPGAEPRPLNRLVVAQDTGAAIRGPVRGDLFWGAGDDAARKAGHMKEQGRYFLLLPKTGAR